MLFQNISFILAIVINIMSLISYEYDEQENSVNNDTEGVIILLGLCVIGMVMIIVLYFLAKTAPLLIKKAWIGVVD